MKLERLSQRRPVGHIIERIARESLGPAAGHNKLRQHAAGERLQAGALPESGVTLISGGRISETVDITGQFIIDSSSIDGTDLIN